MGVITGMLFDLKLPSFDTVISNSKWSITKQCGTRDNLLVRLFYSSRATFLT